VLAHPASPQNGWGLTASLPLSRFIDLQAPATHLSPVKGLNGGTGRIVIVHLNKPEAPGTTGLPIHDHLRRRNRAMLSKEILEFGVRCAEREVSYVDIYTHQSVPFSVGPILRPDNTG